MWNSSGKLGLSKLRREEAAKNSARKKPDKQVEIQLTSRHNKLNPARNMKKRILWESTISNGKDDESLSPKDVLCLDVRGVIFQVIVTDVIKHPDSTLGRLAEYHRHLPDDSRDVEYVFDRDPDVFSQVVQFYSTGELHFPPHVCATIFKRDIDFWGVEIPVAPCCSSAYQEGQSHKEVIQEFRETISEEKDLILNYVYGKNGRSRWRSRLWYFLTYPSSSLGAKIYASIIYLLVVFYLILILIEKTTHHITEPMYSNNETDDVNSSIDDKVRREDAILCQEIMSGFFGPFKYFIYLGIFNIADVTVSTIFALDNLLRLLSAPSIKRAILSYRNAVECICIFPALAYFIYWEVVAIYDICDHGSTTWIPLLWHLKQLRGLHLCVLLLHFMPCRVLIFVVKNNIKKGMITFFFIAIFAFTLTMGALVLVFERIGHGDWRSETFNTNLDAYWWVIITMTTVGYGDVIPETGLGKIIGVVCALSGVLLLAIVIPLMTNNFSIVYNYSRDLDIHPRKDSAKQIKKIKTENIRSGEDDILITKRSGNKLML